MTTLWIPDTCQCQIIVDGSFAFVDFIQKCAIHNAAQDGTGFLNQVEAHNKTFTRRQSDPNNPTDEERQTHVDEKRAEQSRILGIGPPEKKP